MSGTGSGHHFRGLSFDDFAAKRTGSPKVNFRQAAAIVPLSEGQFER
jgi:hypothetical protein